MGPTTLLDLVGLDVHVHASEALWEGLQDDRFLILPHPEVREYYATRATDTDRWLAGMRRLQQRVDDLT